jgi:probable F420-dependent oxidoreductase
MTRSQASRQKPARGSQSTRLTLSVPLQNWSPEARGSWKPMLERAIAADEAGIDRVNAADHVVLGRDLADYSQGELGGRAGGTFPTPPDGHFLEPLTSLATVASVTTRIRLGTRILLAALRRPIILAKTAATLDVLSDGRLDLGVGVGWQRDEYRAAGIEFERRGRMLDHTLEVCRAIWTEAPASYRSAELEIPPLYSLPQPMQPGGIPIWVSGTVNRAVVRRLDTHGCGWILWGDAEAHPADGMRQIRDAFQQAGSDFGDRYVSARFPVVRDSTGNLDLAASFEEVERLVEVGITDFVVSFPLPDDTSALRDLFADLVARFDPIRRA